MHDQQWIARLEAYRDGPYGTIEGWAGSAVVNILTRLVQTFHEANSIDGDIAEIGVHHGKFFLALDTLRRAGERAFVADLFGNQTLNVDRSGEGDRQIFEDNLRRVSHDPSGVTVYEGDSLDAAFQLEIAKSGYGVRIFSVDGGHMPQHAINDLKVAERTLVNGGVVILDDYFNAGFPGVTEGLFRYLAEYPPLVPVCTIGGKLVLISLSYADLFRQHLKGHPVLTEGKFTMRKTQVFGNDVTWIFKYDAAGRKQ